MKWAKALAVIPKHYHHVLKGAAITFLPQDVHAKC